MAQFRDIAGIGSGAITGFQQGQQSAAQAMQNRLAQMQLAQAPAQMQREAQTSALRNKLLQMEVAQAERAPANAREAARLTYVIDAMKGMIPTLEAAPQEQRPALYEQMKRGVLGFAIQNGIMTPDEAQQTLSFDQIGGVEGMRSIVSKVTGEQQVKPTRIQELSALKQAGKITRDEFIRGIGADQNAPSAAKLSQVAEAQDLLDRGVIDKDQFLRMIGAVDKTSQQMGWGEQEWKAWLALPPEDQAAVLNFKRATPTRQVGDVLVTQDPLNPNTAQVLQVPGLQGTTQPEVQQEISGQEATKQGLIAKEKDRIEFRSDVIQKAQDAASQLPRLQMFKDVNTKVITGKLPNIANEAMRLFGKEAREVGQFKLLAGQRLLEIAGALRPVSNEEGKWLKEEVIPSFQNGQLSNDAMLDILIGIVERDIEKGDQLIENPAWGRDELFSRTRGVPIGPQTGTTPSYPDWVKMRNQANPQQSGR